MAYKSKAIFMDRFWSMVDKTDPNGCWLWTGYVTDGGYGQFNTGKSTIKAHVFSYLITHGPVPERHDLDHLCRVRHCVNPAHLEPVTRSENLQRGVNARNPEGLCRRGHPLDGVRMNRGRRRRYCSTCNRENNQRQYAKRAAATQRSAMQ